MLYLPGVQDQAEGSTSCSSSPPTQLLSVISSGRGSSLNDADSCTQCQQQIHDRFLLMLDGQYFHSQCLRCSFCYSELSQESGCHIKEGLVICRQCYPIKYRRTCLKCGLLLLTEDLIMRARDSVFHLNCFTCCICGSQLNAGETFSMNEHSDLFCQLHTQLNLAALDVAKQRSEDSEEQEDDQQPNSRSKRMRTSFKHHQLKAMKLYFTLNHNPDAKDLKQLAQKTGLTKRVLQVWFQNARAKYRRSMQGRDGHTLTLPPAGSDPSTHTVIPQRTGEFTPTSPKFEPESPKASV